ncbi:putative GH43/DUF377 family glycosyl hydrolase [Bradyrhizobium sp. LB14.3]
MPPRSWTARLPRRLRNPACRQSGSNGYAPNVVYTCGALRHHDKIIFPYAVADTFCNFAAINIASLMNAME